MDLAILTVIGNVISSHLDHAQSGTFNLTINMPMEYMIFTSMQKQIKKKSDKKTFDMFFVCSKQIVGAH